MTKHVVTIVAVVVAVCSAPVLAGTLKDGPATAFVFGEDVEKEGLGFGYQVAYEVNKKFSVEFSGLWHEDESSAIAQGIPDLVSAPKADLDVISLALTGRIHVELAPNVQAYAGAGLGYYIIETENQGVRERFSNAGLAVVGADGDKEFGAHILIGTEILLTSHWELFAELRQVFLDSAITVRSSPDRDSPAEAQRKDLSYDHLMLRVGLNYRF